MGKFDELLKRIYYSVDDPAGFASIAKLYRRAREEAPTISNADVRQFLRAQPTYTLHRPYRKRFARNKTLAQDIDFQWQADLADLPDHAAANDDSRYILTIVDVFSRYAWAVPVAKKSGPRVRDAFAQVFASGRKPQHLQTDKGKEFFNKDVQALMRLHGVKHFASNSDQKAALVERFNRTLKQRMEGYTSYNNTRRYLEILPRLLAAYNSSTHRSLGMSPAQVSKENASALWRRQYGSEVARATTPGLSARTPVRLSKVKALFEKGTTPNSTEEMFRIVRQRPGPGGRRVYKLEDWRGESIEGQFYEQEVQQIEPSDLIYVERVIRTRKRGRLTESLIKWRGWPAKFNSWINQKELVKLNVGVEAT